MLLNRTIPSFIFTFNTFIYYYLVFNGHIKLCIDHQNVYKNKYTSSHLINLYMLFSELTLLSNFTQPINNREHSLAEKILKVGDEGGVR